MKGYSKSDMKAAGTKRRPSARGDGGKAQKMANAIAKPDRIQAGAGRAARLARQGRAGKKS